MTQQPIVEAPPPYSRYSDDTPDDTASTPSSTVASLSSTRSASPTPPPATDIKLSPQQQQQQLQLQRQQEEVQRQQQQLQRQRQQQQQQHQQQQQQQQQQQSSSAASGEPKPSLPSNLSRARAPLQVRQENSSINSNFFVLKGEGSSDSRPEVSLRTKNARISSAVYVDAAAWGRTVTIEAETKNSSIALAVHTLQPGQAVNIIATTKNSSNGVLLPRDFTGLLMLSTSHGKEILSPALREVAVRVPNPEEDVDADDNSLIGSLVKSITEDDKTTSWYEINGSDGPSRAVITTKNSKVSAGFVGDDEGACDRSCVIM